MAIDRLSPVTNLHGRREKHSTVNDFYPRDSDKFQGFRKPSEVFRKMNQQVNDDKNAAMGDSDSRSQRGAQMYPQSGLTFNEFKKYRQSMREQKTQAEEDYLQDDDEDDDDEDEHSRRENRKERTEDIEEDMDEDVTEEDESIEEVIVPKAQKMNKKGMAKDNSNSGDKSGKGSGKKSVKNSKNMEEKDLVRNPEKILEQILEKRIERKTLEEKVVSDKRKPEEARPDSSMGDTVATSKSRAHEEVDKVKTDAVKESYWRDNEGGPQSGKQHVHLSQLESQNEKTPTSENLVCSSEKTCEQCYSSRYYVLAIIVSAIWLINIVFVFWIFCGRENRSTMKIPKGFEHKSPQTSGHFKSFTVSHELEKSTGIRQTSKQRGKRTTTVQSKSKKPRSTSTTVASQTLDSQEYYAATLSLTEVSQISNIQEDGKTKVASTVLGSPIIGHHTIATLTNFRSHISNKSSSGNVQYSLSPIAETSNEESINIRERRVNSKVSRLKTQGQIGNKKMRKVQRIEEQSQITREYTDRREVSTTVTLNNDIPQPRAGDISDISHLRKVVNVPESPAKREVLRASCPKHDGQGDPCTHTAEAPADTMQVVVLDKGNPSDNNNVCVKDNVRDERGNLPEQKSRGQDVATQISLIDVTQRASPKNLATELTATTKCSATSVVEKPKNVELCHTDACALQPIVTCPKLTEDTYCYHSSRVMDAKSRVHDTWQVTGHDRIEEQNDGCENGLITFMPTYERLQQQHLGSPTMKRSWADMKLSLPVNQRHEHKEHRSIHRHETKLSKVQRHVSHETRSCLIEDEGLMPPPPFGYHVRRDFSNPDTSTEFVRKVHVANTGDTNAPAIQNIASICDHTKSLSPLGADSSNGNSEPLRTLLPKEHLLDRGFGSRLHDCLDGSVYTDNVKSTKKLIIIGKLNNVREGYKRLGKHTVKNQFTVSRDRKSMLYDSNHRSKEKVAQRFAKIAWAYPKVATACDDNTMGNVEQKSNKDRVRSTKSFIEPAHMGTMESSGKCYYKLVDNQTPNIPETFFKRSTHQSSWKMSSGERLKQGDLMLEAEHRKYSHRTVKDVESQRSLHHVMSKNKKQSKDRRRNHKYADVYTKLGLISSRHMNLNSNAGISECCTEEIMSQNDITPDASVQCVDQHDSTSLPTETNSTENEIKVTPSISLTQEMEDDVAVITQETSEPSLNVSKCSEQMYSNMLEKDDNALIELPQECTESDVLETFHHGKTLEQICPQTAEIVKDDNYFSQSPTDLAVTSTETGPPSINSRLKKKPNITDMAVLKFESITSKKTTRATTAAKDIRGTLLNKPRKERSKQISRTVDVQKVVSSVMDKANKNMADSLRLAKAVKHSEIHYDNLETKQKQKLGHDANLDYVFLKESHHQTILYQNASSQAVRTAESNRRHGLLKNVGTTSLRNEEGGQMKRLVSLPKTMPSQACSDRAYICHHLTTSDATDSKSNDEMMSPEFIKFNKIPSSQAWQKELLESSAKMETVSNLDLQSNSGSPKTERITSPKMKLDICSPNTEFSFSPKMEFSRSSKMEHSRSPQMEFSRSPKIEHSHSPKMEYSRSPKMEFNCSPKIEFSRSPKMELNNLQEKQEIIELPTNLEEENIDNKLDEIEEDLVLQTGFVKCVDSVEVSKSPEFVDMSARKDLRCYKGDPHYRSLDNTVNHISRKVVQKMTTEDSSTKGARSNSINGRPLHHANLVKKKKPPLPFSKSQSRSRDSKKKRTIVPKSSTELNSSKTENVKKLKPVEKLFDKKKKKKKQKSKLANITDDDSHQIHPRQTNLPIFRSMSSESRKRIPHSVSSYQPASRLLNMATSETSMLPAGHSTTDRSCRPPTMSRSRPPLCDERVVDAMDKENICNVEVTIDESHTTFPEENICIPSEPTITDHSIESQLQHVVPVTNVPARVIQFPSFPKIRRNDRDLQKAELGWNSSTFSSDEKATAEKIKQIQKRAKVRYYLLKPKQQKIDNEVVTSKLKRPPPKLDHPDREIARCCSAMDINSDIVPQERSKPGAGKSVQFSDDIEDLEASKEESGNEKIMHKPLPVNVMNHVFNKTSTEAVKSFNRALDIEMPVTGKSAIQKKDEPRLQVTPPRRRRPVWLKKSHEKRAEINKFSAAGKSGAPVLLAQQHQSSDSVAKASARFNIHVYYPVKPTIGSPKLSNASQNDQHNVAYNKAVNSVFLAPPVNKTTKKIVAKTGSPVDIKEIIEGSSVDAADHLRAKRPSSENNVRAARSVPSLAPQRDITVGKKIKASDDFRLMAHKKSKDIKLRDNWSPRSQSLPDTKGDHVTAAKGGPVTSDVPTNLDYSTNVDSIVRLKKKNVIGRFMDQGNTRKLVKRLSLKKSQENASKWQLVPNQESGNKADLTQARYCGDIMELNVLNMGLAWVVQSVVSRLSFLNPRQADPAIPSSRDLTSDQQIVE